MAYETLIVEIEDYTCLIRLNRPDAMNALNIKLMSELADAITAADRNDKIRCIVVTGSDKAFAAGADVREMAEKSYVDVYFDDLFGPEAEAITRVLIESTDASGARWWTVGVSENIIDASFQALMDSIVYKLMKNREMAGLVAAE